MMLKPQPNKAKAEALALPAAAFAKKAIEQHPSIHAIAIGLPQINLGLLHFRHEVVIEYEIFRQYASEQKHRVNFGLTPVKKSSAQYNKKPLLYLSFRQCGRVGGRTREWLMKARKPPPAVREHRYERQRPSDKRAPLFRWRTLIFGTLCELSRSNFSPERKNLQVIWPTDGFKTKAIKIKNISLAYS